MENPEIRSHQPFKDQQVHGATHNFALYRRIAPRLLPGLQAIPGETPAAWADSQLTRQIEALALKFNAERRRGLEGHWTHDPNRLAALKQAYDLAVEMFELLHPTEVQPPFEKGRQNP